jgi:hypothetical protein
LYRYTKEDAKYKVAFFDMDAVVASGGSLEAQLSAINDAKLESMPAWLRFIWKPLFALIRFVKKSDAGAQQFNAFKVGLCTCVESR